LLIAQWHQLPPRYEKKFRWYLAFVVNIVTTFGSLAVLLYFRFSAHKLQRYAHAIDGRQFTMHSFRFTILIISENPAFLYLYAIVEIIYYAHIARTM